jgi:hemerythrin-like domain-containing protein
VIAAHEHAPDLREMLLAHHHDLERTCCDLLGETYADDSLALIAAWRRFEDRLRRHMALEEAYLLGPYAHSHRDDATEIRRQHDSLRALMTPLAIEVELHVIRAETVERLVNALRAHAAHEDTSMYPWAQRHLRARERSALVEGLDEG